MSDEDIETVTPEVLPPEEEIPLKKGETYYFADEDGFKPEEVVRFLENEKPLSDDALKEVGKIVGAIGLGMVGIGALLLMLGNKKKGNPLPPSSQIENPVDPNIPMIESKEGE